MSGHLLSDIQAFLDETGMGEFQFGLQAARNGRLMQQLRSKRKNGEPSRVWPETEIKIRAFMAAERRVSRTRAPRAPARTSEATL